MQNLTASQIKARLITAIKSGNRTEVALIKKEAQRRILERQKAGTSTDRLDGLAARIQ